MEMFARWTGLTLEIHLKIIASRTAVRRHPGRRRAGLSAGGFRLRRGRSGMPEARQGVDQGSGRASV